MTGLLGITVTGDVFNVFVFLEISSLSAYALIAMGQDRRALSSAYQYLIMGSVGATFIVIGIGLMYAMTGTLNMVDLSERLPAVMGTRTIPVAFAFLTVGFSLKLALFPLHLWLPNAYTYAPSAVTSFIASTATKVAVYMMLRFFFTVFGAAFSFDRMHVDLVFLPLALVAIFSMSLVAIFQANVKRMLAFSSVAQIGYMILGVSMASVTGPHRGHPPPVQPRPHEGCALHGGRRGVLPHRIGAPRCDEGARQEDALDHGRVRRGWPQHHRCAAHGRIHQQVVSDHWRRWSSGWWPVAVLVLITSLMAVVYIWKVVEVAYFEEFPGEDHSMAEAPPGLLIPLWALVIANFWFGIDASYTATVAGQAAELLLGVGTMSPELAAAGRRPPSGGRARSSSSRSAAGRTSGRPRRWSPVSPSSRSSGRCSVRCSGGARPRTGSPRGGAGGPARAPGRAARPGVRARRVVPVDRDLACTPSGTCGVTTRRTRPGSSSSSRSRSPAPWAWPSARTCSRCSRSTKSSPSAPFRW